MRITIKGLSEIRQRLEHVRPEAVVAPVLAEQAERLAEAVRERLSTPEGSSPHDSPWVRTGALRDSIGATASGLEAVVGSNDRAAAPQELGTSRIPPRPFLAPTATAAADGIASAVGTALAAALKGETPTS